MEWSRRCRGRWGIVFGILAYVAIRYGVGWYLAASDSPVTQEMGRQLLATGMYAPLAWMFLAICWLGALLSWLARRKGMRALAGLLETEAPDRLH